MAFDKLTDAISPDAPCGPDLLEEDDGDFVDYYYDADGRMPEKYYDLVREALFDAKDIDLNAEVKQIEGLLKKSRDLRLLNIGARFSLLAGKLPRFCEAVIAMGDLVETYPDDVHPRTEADNAERRNAMEELNNFHHVLAPLQYATLLVDKRIGDVSYRKYAVSAALVEPRGNETPGDASAMVAALGSDENQKAVDKLHGDLTGVRSALAKMQAASKADAHNAFTPNFEKLEERLGEVINFVEQARGDLAGSNTQAADAEGNDAVADAGGDADSTVPASQAVPSSSVPDLATAKAALRGVESYFAANEPSAAALLLITQARLLIGRPLVEALDTLLPDRSGSAMIDFGPETGFVISMDRMRTLTNEVSDLMNGAPQAAPPPPPSPPPAEPELDEEGNPLPVETAEEPAAAPPPPASPATAADMSVSNRAEAAGMIKGVEDFFRAREPASPIPVLLFKARSYLDKDFQALVRELLPSAVTQSGGE